MNTARFATTEEIDHWDDLVIANPSGGDVLQGRVFTDLKKKAGWRIRHIIVGNVAVAAMEKTIPLFGKIWYIPRGPGVSTADELLELIRALRQFAIRHRIISLKVEPVLPIDTPLGNIDLLPTHPIQYNCSTVLVDLHDGLETVLAHLPQKGRHAIRRAERDGVTVRLVPSTRENCDIMYDLFLTTAQGAGFVIRPRSYYREFYHRFSEAGQGQLFFAYFNGQLVAGAYAIVYGHKSTYKDGASVRDKITYGASHYLQWRVIEWAKQHGSTSHDLCGTPPARAIDDATHPFYGLGRFKTSFNKSVTDYVGALNLPIRPVRGLLWHHFLEKVVRRLYFLRHHESYY